MQIAVCITGVNDKQSNIVAQIQQQISGANIYYHTFTNRTNLVPRNLHDNLFTMHYPKWHYHPKQVPNVKHGKFQKYVDKKYIALISEQPTDSAVDFIQKLVCIA